MLLDLQNLKLGRYSRIRVCIQVKGNFFLLFVQKIEKEDPFKIFLIFLETGRMCDRINNNFYQYSGTQRVMFERPS